MKTATQSSSLHASKLNTLIMASLFISLNIIFTYIFAVQTPFIRISFGFLPVAIFAALFGPLKGAVMAAAADILGCLIFSPGLYFPGFTVSAFIAGLIYGTMLYRKQPSLKRIFFACFFILLLVDLLLNTIWLSFLYHKAAQTFLLGRMFKETIMLPIQTLLIYTVYIRIFKQKSSK